MKSNHLKTIAVLGASSLMLGYAHAQSQFTFSFTSVPGGYYVAGTVTGIITLNAAQNAATSILLTSVPPGDGALLGYDFVTQAQVFLNSFAVTGGNISSAQFDSDFFTPPAAELSMGFADFFSAGAGELYNPGGDPAITFAPVETPEPGTLALAALGAGAMLKLRRRN